MTHAPTVHSSSRTSWSAAQNTGPTRQGGRSAKCCVFGSLDKHARQTCSPELRHRLAFRARRDVLRLGYDPRVRRCGRSCRGRHDFLRRVDLLHLGVVLPTGTSAKSGDDRCRRTARQHARVRALPWAWLPHDKGWLVAATQFPGTLFFNHSTFAALAHNLSAAEADQHIWRPDFFGSVLFLVSSAYAIAALGSGPWRQRLRDLPWWIAWINMLGSVAFMASAIASYVLPSTDAVIDVPLSNAGTFLGAVCFLVAATLMVPAWRAEVRSRSGHPAR